MEYTNKKSIADRSIAAKSLSKGSERALISKEPHNIRNYHGDLQGPSSALSKNGSPLNGDSYPARVHDSGF